jgi:glutamyl-tRNA reductase
MMLVLGIDHHDASAATVARLGRAADTLAQQLAEESSVRGVVVLRTCARLEAYLDVSRFHDVHRAFIGAVARGADLPIERVASLTRSHRGHQALEHLFRVTAGLESAVVGEVQIAGQVREALNMSRSRGTTTRPLDIGFENAIRVSRQARRCLDAPAASVIAAALDMVFTPSPPVPMGQALVIGTGEFARICVDEVRARGAHTVLVHSPSGRTLPDGMADGFVTADELPLALALTDVVIGASGGGRTVVTEELAEQALLGRAAPLILVDLAAADDVARSLDHRADVILVRIDDVRRQALGADAAAAIISREATALYPRIEGREVDDVIVALRQHVHSLADVDSAADPAVAEAVRRITQSLLHTPTVRAREAAQSGELERYRSALEMVFGIVNHSAGSAMHTGGAA